MYYQKRRFAGSQNSGSNNNPRSQFNRGGSNSNGVRSHFSSRSRGPKDQKIDPQMFINKATPIEDAAPYVSKNAFEDFEISDELKQNISIKNYTSPTPIQDQTIPAILSGRDVIGVANTGTGKTAAFLIPLVQKVLTNRFEKILIITPTRELAVQIQDELRGFSHRLNMHSALCIGGASMHRQIIELRQKPNFVIGTPGRIKDLIERRSLDLSQFRNIVLDEVDRMVDIGFIRDIKHIVALLPERRQSLFFSATVTGQTEEVLKAFVKNPVTVSVRKQNTSQNIDQNIIRVKDKSAKLDMLHDLLIQKEFEKVIVFGKTKWGIEKLSSALIQRGFKATAIHGNKSQGQRQRAIDDFKNNKVNVLLATDVASRGLDIDNVTHVINFDIPATYDDYIHRIGRTGRANKQGVALTFVE